MVTTDYLEKLKDPRWQKKRLEILQRDNWACQICFDTESTLHIHHRRYLTDTEPWDYPNKLLVTLCESCHEYEKAKSGCESDLIAILKENFFADDFYELFIGFMQMELQHSHEIVASTIAWAISDPNIQGELIERYFEHLKEIKELLNGER